MRREKAVPILDNLYNYLISIKDDWDLDGHPLRQAINYMLCRFDNFRAYTLNGCYEIDNNLIENAVRPLAIGRRNWMFAGSDAGAKAAATMYTVLQSCKRLKIDVHKYLTNVLPKLASSRTTSLVGLTPMDWDPAV